MGKDCTCCTKELGISCPSCASCPVHGNPTGEKLTLGKTQYYENGKPKEPTSKPSDRIKKRSGELMTETLKKGGLYQSSEDAPGYYWPALFEYLDETAEKINTPAPKGIGCICDYQNGALAFQINPLCSAVVHGNSPDKPNQNRGDKH